MKNPPAAGGHLSSGFDLWFGSVHIFKAGLDFNQTNMK